MIIVKKLGNYYKVYDSSIPKKLVWFATLDNAKDYIRTHYECECRLYYFAVNKFYLVRRKPK